MEICRLFQGTLIVDVVLLFIIGCLVISLYRYLFKEERYTAIRVMKLKYYNEKCIPSHVSLLRKIKTLKTMLKYCVWFIIVWNILYYLISYVC